MPTRLDECRNIQREEMGVGDLRFAIDRANVLAKLLESREKGEISVIEFLNELTNIRLMGVGG